MLENLFDAFLVSIPVELEQLKTALEQGRIDEAGRHAHSIKGEAANIGAEAIRETAWQMEQAAKSGLPDTVRGGLAGLVRELAEFASVARGLK